MSIYSTGVRYEYKTMDKLEEEGYDVIRTAGSHGTFDVIGIKHDKIKLIQVKSSSKDYVLPKVKKQINAYSCPETCDKELWLYVKYDRDSPYVKKL